MRPVVSSKAAPVPGTPHGSIVRTSGLTRWTVTPLAKRNLSARAGIGAAYAAAPRSGLTTAARRRWHWCQVAEAASAGVRGTRNRRLCVTAHVAVGMSNLG